MSDDLKFRQENQAYGRGCCIIQTARLREAIRGQSYKRDPGISFIE